MSRLLVCGPSPLPFEDVARSYGSGLRTWQLAWSLAHADHDVLLVAIKTDGAYDGEQEPVEHETRDGVDIVRLPYIEAMDPSLLRRRIQDFRPDAVVGATIFGSFALAKAAVSVPFWADHFGDAMAEAQAKARLEGSNWPLANFWRLAEPALRCADRISAVSTPQRYALIGELGAVGRLTAENCGHDLTAVVPCGAQPATTLPPREALRFGRFSSEDFILLWSGGFNVWSDVDTLFDAVSAAMDHNTRIQLLVTGGAIAGHDDRTFSRFRALVEGSPHRDRFHLEGWVAASRVSLYVAAADLGVLSELPIYEGLLGSKNRIVRWLMDGLAVSCNKVGELGESLTRENAALTFEPKDSDALRRSILWAASHPAELEGIAARGRRLAREEFTFLATTAELVSWAHQPTRAPDAHLRRQIRSPSDFASAQFRLGKLAYRLPLLRRSPFLRKLWRQWKGSGRK